LDLTEATYTFTNILEVINSRRMQWLEHVAQMVEQETCIKDLKRETTWETENFKMNLGKTLVKV
jgi:hypothetical protein